MIAAAACLLAGSAHAAEVELVAERADVAACKRLGQIKAGSGWGGFGATGLGYNRSMASLKRKAAALGGTHILMISSSNTMGGTNMIADAYRCDAPAEPTSAPTGASPSPDRQSASGPS